MSRRTWSRRSSRSTAATCGCCARATARRCSTRRRSSARSSCRTGPSCGRARSRSPARSPAARCAAPALWSSAAGSGCRASPRRSPAAACSPPTGPPTPSSSTAANAERNGAGLDTMVCSWTEPEPLLAQAPWDLVLASDVLYERRNADLLLELLPRLTREVWLADPGRPPAAPIPRGGGPDLGDHLEALAGARQGRRPPARAAASPGGTRPWRAGRVPPRSAMRTTVRTLGTGAARANSPKG